MLAGQEDGDFTSTLFGALGQKEKGKGLHIFKAAAGY